MKKQIVKTIVCVTTALVMSTASLTVAETLFGSGTITIATNEAILINSMYAYAFGYGFTNALLLDGTNHLTVESQNTRYEPHYAIAGPHTLTINSDPGSPAWITFQRLQGTAIRTVAISVGATNAIDVPAGRTIQFFPVIKGDLYSLTMEIQPLGSTNVYLWDEGRGYRSPSFTGPVTVRLIDGYGSETKIVSYYFTDEIVQLPQTGLFGSASPIFEIDVEKSHNLIDWTPTAAFHTEAENGAFYRLRILK